MKRMSLLISLFILFLLNLSAATAQEVHVCFLFLDFPQENMSSGTLNTWEDGVVTPVIEDVFGYASDSTEMYFARKMAQGYQILNGNQTVLFESLNDFGGMSAYSGTVVWSDVFFQEDVQTSILFRYQTDTNRVESLPDYDGAIMPLMTSGELFYLENNYLVFPENFVLTSMYAPNGFQSYSIDPLNAFVVYTYERQLMARQHNEPEAIPVTPDGFSVDNVAWYGAFALIFSGEDESGTQGVWLIRLPDGNNRHKRELQPLYESPEGRIATSPSYCQSAVVND